MHQRLLANFFLCTVTSLLIYWLTEGEGKISYFRYCLLNDAKIGFCYKLN